MVLWRISNYATLDGIGGFKFSARWHTKGRPVVYATDHPASALLEMLVHTDRALLPDSFKLLKIEVPSDIIPFRGTPSANWRNDIKISRDVGDKWLKNGESLLLEVPSAILPDVFHTLINPQHADAKRLKIMSVQGVPLDVRLK